MNLKEALATAEILEAETGHPYRVTRVDLEPLYVVPGGVDSYGLANPYILLGNDIVAFLDDVGKNWNDWEARDYKELYDELF